MVDSAGNNEPGRKNFLTRRRFVLGILLTSVTSAFASLLALFKDLVPEIKNGGYRASILPGDKLVYAKGEKAGSLLRASAFKAGDAVLAFPEGKTANPANLVQLIRLDEATFKAPTRLDFTDQGFAAYSAICTHLGCTVSWERNPQTPAASLTECLCHNSLFDPAHGAKVLAGPAPIPLAQIGVKVGDDDSLHFSGDFTGPIGPQLS